jgi:hypothetical protein
MQNQDLNDYGCYMMNAAIEYEDLMKCDDDYERVEILQELNDSIENALRKKSQAEGDLEHIMEQIGFTS